MATQEEMTPAIRTALNFANGNIGAASVMIQVSQHRHADDVFTALELLGFKGPDIWYAFSHFCDSRMEMFIACCLDLDQGMAKQVAIHRR